jgi:hypothetical protein
MAIVDIKDDKYPTSIWRSPSGWLSAFHRFLHRGDVRRVLEHGSRKEEFSPSSLSKCKELFKTTKFPRPKTGALQSVEYYSIAATTAGFSNDWPHSSTALTIWMQRKPSADQMDKA